MMGYNIGITTPKTPALLSVARGTSKPDWRSAMPDHTPLLPGFKRCRICSDVLPASPDFFSRDKSKADGLQSACKACASERRHAWYLENRQHAIDYSEQWTVDHYDHVLEQHRAWRKSNRDKADGYNERWKLSHRAQHLASRRRRYNAHAETRRLEARAWRRANPDKVRIQWKVRQARKRSVGGNHTTDDIRRLYDLQDGRCAYCGITLYDEYHVDHVVPLARGGSNDPDNLALSCALCNLSKKDKTVAEWQEVRGW